MAEEDNTHKKPKILSKTGVRVVPAASKHVSNQLSGFNEFLKEYGVVALAVGFVFGAQVKSVVDQFTSSVINPVLGLVLPGTGNLAEKSWVVHSSGKTTVFAWGALAETLISFIIIAFLIYFTVKAFQLDRLTKK